MVDRIRVNFPLGRIVQGDLYKPNDTDWITKQKRVYPAGHRLAGQPKISYFFAVAIPKIPGHTHWGQTEWGRKIYEFGFAAWPLDQRTGQSAAQRPDFAWKIEDGDSTVPNKANRINARSEGMPGCWVVGFSSVYAPKILATDFSPILEAGAVKRGFHVECVGSIDTNESAGNPGIYINGEFVMFKAIDREISGAIDPRTIQGFGSSVVPAGLTAAGGGLPPATGAPAMTPSPSPSFPMPGAAPVGFPGAPGALPPPVGAPALMGAPGPAVMAPATFPFSPPPVAGQTPPFAAPPTAVAPAQGFLPNLAQPAAPPAPMPAPAGGPFKALTAKAPPGVTYEQFRAQGWTDDMMRSQGYLT